MNLLCHYHLHIIYTINLNILNKASNILFSFIFNLYFLIFLIFLNINYNINQHFID